MKNFTIIACATMLLGCSQSNEDTMLVTKYWEAQQNSDLNQLKTLLADPDHIGTLKHLKMEAESFTILKQEDDGVIASFSRFCYPDLIIKTPVIEVNGVNKVDSRATLKNLIKASRSDYAPVKKYCYDFDNAELIGKINGQIWSSKKIAQKVIDWGSKKTISISIHPENCDTEYVGKCMLPSLIISNLDLNNEGGNMTSSENITIHTPPSDNNIISKGSYRVTQQSEGNTKVEISFKYNEQNYLNGFVILKKRNITRN